MKAVEMEAIKKIVDFLNGSLDKLPISDWTSVGFKLALAFAKVNNVYDIVNYSTLRAHLLKIIDDRLPKKIEIFSENLGLKITRIEKTDELFTLTTDKGKIFMHGDELFSQQLFRKKVFASLGVYVNSISRAEWEYLIALWASCVQKDDKENSPAEIIKDALSQFLEEADPRANAFLRKGMPIINGEEYRFRISDFLKFLNREFDKTITRPQVIFSLRELNLEPDTDGRIRFWKISLKAYDQENPRPARDGQDDGAPE